MGKRNHLYRTGIGFAKILKGRVNFNLLDKFNENVFVLDRYKNVIDSFTHQSIVVSNSSKADICRYYVYKFLDSFPGERFAVFASHSFNRLEESRIFSSVCHSITSITSIADLKDILREFRSGVTPGLLIQHPLKRKINIPFVRQIIHFDVPLDLSDLVARLSNCKTQLQHDSDELLIGNSLIIHTNSDFSEYNNLIINMSDKIQQLDVIQPSMITDYFINRYQNELIHGLNLNADVSPAQLDNAQVLLRVHGISIVKSALQKLDKMASNDAWRSILGRKYNFVNVLVRDPSHSVIISRAHLKQLLTLNLKENFNLISNITHTNEGFIIEMPIKLALDFVKAPLNTPEEWDVKNKINLEILKKKPLELKNDRKSIHNSEAIIKQIKKRLDRGYIGNPKTKRKLLKRLASANERREITLLRRRARLGLFALNKL